MVRLFSASQSVILVLRRMAPMRRMARRLAYNKRSCWMEDGTDIKFSTGGEPGGHLKTRDKSSTF